MNATRTLDATEAPWWRIVDIEPLVELETLWLRQDMPRTTASDPISVWVPIVVKDKEKV